MFLSETASDEYFKKTVEFITDPFFSADKKCFEERKEKNYSENAIVKKWFNDFFKCLTRKVMKSIFCGATRQKVSTDKLDFLSYILGPFLSECFC